jgi:hypothetical protein
MSLRADCLKSSAQSLEQIINIGVFTQSVPVAASYDALLSVSFRENRRSDSVGQGRLRALNGLP